MPNVHPSFDTEARVWFTDNGTEAPSLRELQKKLPAGTKIIGYFPKGYGLIFPPVVKKAPILSFGDVPTRPTRPTYQPQRRYVARSPVRVEPPEPELPDEPIKEFPPAEFVSKGPTTHEIPGRAPQFKAEGYMLLAGIDIQEEGPGTRADEPKPVVDEPEPVIREPEPTTPIETLPEPVKSEAEKSRKLGEMGGQIVADLFISGEVMLRHDGTVIRGWTPEQDVELKDYVKANRPDSWIAEQMGRTKNSIIGRRHRLKIARSI